jgi:ribosomal protein S12 methylthiotransferase accessory factor
MLAEASRQQLDRLLGLWDVLVDPKVGIINEVYELPIEDDDPNFFHYLSRACNTARLTPLKNFANNGGVSTDRYVGIAKAMGEAVERYCSAFFDYNELLLCCFRDVPKPATPPGAYALYRPEQYHRGDLQWVRFDEDSVVCWTEGTSLVDGKQVMLPAAMVFVPYHYRLSAGEAPIVQPISTGLAAGCSFEEATLSGLCEVLERDAFTITWQAKLSRRRIDPATVPPSCLDLLRRYRDAGLDVRIMDITSDIRVPTFMTIALGHAETSPAVAVAAATDPSAEVALRKSLEELAHTRKFARQLMEYTPPIPVEPEAGHPRVEDQRHHLRFYCPQSSKEHIAFAFASDECHDFASVVDLAGMSAQAALRTISAQIAAAGLDVIARELTTPDLKPLGLSVVRVVVPGMNPLFMGHKNRALGGARLYEVPDRLGYQGLRPGDADNPFPHPFP